MLVSCFKVENYQWSLKQAFKNVTGESTFLYGLEDHPNLSHFVTNSFPKNDGTYWQDSIKSNLFLNL